MTPARRAATATHLGVAAGTALALLSAFQIYGFRRALDEPVSVGAALAYGLASWVVWAGAVPVVLALGRRFDFAAGRRLRSLAAHALALLAVYVPATLVLLLSGIAIFSPDEAIPWQEVPRQLFATSRLQFGLLLYVGILGLGRATATREALQRRDLEAARLEAAAVRARLDALAARLQPHFLFNTLHAIGALMEDEPKRARRMLVALGDLLREVLGGGDSADVPLAAELALLERYTAIERMRFSDRLAMQVRVADEVRTALVPRLLLQPVVENAITHGIAPRAAGGTVEVAARRDAGMVEILVRNDGAPLAEQWSEGHGLRLTRERLATRFGPDATLIVGTRDGWVETILRFPLEVAAR